MKKFKNVKIFYKWRISIFLALGIICNILTGLPLFRILGIPDFIEYPLNLVGMILIAIGSYYLSRYRAFEKVDDVLMNKVDDACNILIRADDDNKLQPLNNDKYSPKLLIEQIKEFGIRILEAFCEKEILQLVEGGIFLIKDPLLPPHKKAIYPTRIKNIIIENKEYINMYKLIHYYIENHQDNIAILITNKSGKVEKLVDNKDNQKIEINDGEIEAYLSEGKIPLPSQKAIITPITYKENNKNKNMGYLLLFYHSQNFLSRLFNPKEMIDNYMLEKIEDWKLDDAIKSVLNKERLLLAFYLEKVVDEITTKAIEKGENYYRENFSEICEEVLKAICIIMKIDGGGFLFDFGKQKLVIYETNIAKRDIEGNIIPKIRNSNSEKVDIFTDWDVENNKQIGNNILYVNIKYENRELGLLGLIASRDFEDFDKMVLNILEDIKLDDLFILFEKKDDNNNFKMSN